MGRCLPICPPMGDYRRINAPVKSNNYQSATLPSVS